MTNHNETTRSDDRVAGDTSSGDSPSRGRIRHRNPPPDDPSPTPPRRGRRRRRRRSASTDGDVGERPSQARQAAETGTHAGTGPNTGIGTDNGTGANTETGSGTGGDAGQRAEPKPERNQPSKPVVNDNTPADDRSYEVGYGKPPQHARFRKGKSGNPKGRPKGRKNIKTLLREGLDDPLLYRSGKEEKRISYREGIALRHRELALKGDRNAMKLMMEVDGGATLITPGDEPGERPVKAPKEIDLRILKEFEDQIRECVTLEQAGKADPAEEEPDDDAS